MKQKFLVYTLIIISLFNTNTTSAQKNKPRINHIAIYVKDLQVSTAFYKYVVGLDTIPEPFHDGKHTWFSLGATGHLHVISGAAKPTEHNKNSHLCFSVRSIEEFIRVLQAELIVYENWAGEKNAVTTRVDGIKQLWFQDPDGYWIEINNDY